MFTRLGRLRNDDSVAQIAGKAVADGKESGGGEGRKGGARMGKTIIRKQGEEDVKS